jgi:CheY-like chemotaxis protein
MLEQIEIAEYMLQQANDELELRVEERTAQLDYALIKAEEASKAKSDFLARMSHEIRTPMNAMLGFAENLLDESLDETERRDAIRTIRRNGEHLLTIINDILDLSKIEAGKFDVQRARCSPFAIVAEVVSLMQVRAGEKQLAFASRFEGRVPQSIETDPQLLRQILINLAANAIKFTDQGSVTLTTRLMYSELGDPIMQFAVADTGIGMSDDQCRKIFDPFTQGDETMSRRYGGTGLGLPISRRLAQMLGGDITVSSRLNVGSTFTMEVDPGPLDGIKLLDAPQRELVVKDRPDPRAPRQVVEELNCRILLAEDGLDNQRLIAFILKKVGAEVTVVENGQIAIEAALAARDGGRPFDVILMDMQMPVRDGYSATMELRQQDYSGAIIALTAHAMSGAREKCLDAGCDDYTAKPIDRVELLAKIKKSVQFSVAGFQQQPDAIKSEC